MAVYGPTVHGSVRAYCAWQCTGLLCMSVYGPTVHVSVRAYCAWQCTGLLCMAVYRLTVHGRVQILRRSNFGTSLVCMLRKEILTIWLSAECRICCTSLQSIERHIKLNSVTFAIRAEGSLCWEVDGAILTSEYNDMLHCRRTVTKAESDANADALLVFGVVIDLTREWLYVGRFGTKKTYITIKITQCLSCPLAVQRLRHCGVRITICGGFMDLQEGMGMLWPWENLPWHTASSVNNSVQFNAFHYCLMCWCDNQTVNYEQNKSTRRK